MQSGIEHFGRAGWRRMERTSTLDITGQSQVRGLLFGCLFWPGLV